MNRKLLGYCAGLGMAALAGKVVAAPFVSFDPRSMAMGGAGVAVSDFNNAPIFNPALLADAGEDDDFNLAFPVFGARILDQDDLIDTIDEDIDSAIDTVDSISNLIDTRAANPATLQSSDFIALADATDLLNQTLADISDRAVVVEAGFAAVVGIPSRKFAGAVSLVGWTASGGVGRYQDEALLDSLAADAREASTRTFVGPVPCTGLSNFNADCSVNFTTDNLQSEVAARGVAVGEVGLSLARQFPVGESSVAVGITPKIVTATVFDYREDAKDAEFADFQDSTDTSSNFNIDLGVAHNYGNGWRVGAVVKNLLTQEYDAPIPAGATEQFTLKLEPQVRGGVSYQNEWFLIAADLDLIENSAIGFGNKSQTLSLGAELDAWDWFQLRGGFRTDLSDSDRQTYAIGAGFSPLGMHIDVALTGDGDDEFGFAGQLAFTF